MFSILFSWTLLRVYDVILSQHFLAWIWYTEVPTHTWSYGMMWLWFWKPTGKLTLRVLQVLREKNWKKNKLVQDYCLVNDEATSRVPVPLNLTIRAFLLSLLIWPEMPRSLWDLFDRLWVQLRRIWVFVHNLLNWTRIFVAKLSAYVNTAITLGYRANQDGWNLWEEMVSACPPPLQICLKQFACHQALLQLSHQVYRKAIVMRTILAISLWTETKSRNCRYGND